MFRSFRCVLLVRLIFVVFVLFSLAVSAETDSTVFKVSSLDSWMLVSPKTRLSFDPLSGEFANSAQREIASYNYFTIPLEQTPLPHYQFFGIDNDRSDTASFYFYQTQSGKTSVWQTDSLGDAIRKILPASVQSTVIKQEVFLLRLPPGATAYYAIRIEPLLEAHYIISTYLIPVNQMSRFFNSQAGSYWNVTIQNMWMCGMLSMMLLYIIAKYIQIRSSVYLFYALYILFFFLYFLLREISIWNRPLARTPIYYEHIEQMLQIAAYTMYFPFAQRFLNTKVILPTIHRWMNWIVSALAVYMVVNLVLIYIPAAMLFRWQLWDTVRISLLVSEFIITLLLLRAKSPYIRFLVIGSAMLAFFAMLSMIFSIDENWIKGFPLGFDRAITYFQIGLVLEILFFSSVLGYKNRMDEVQRIQAEEKLKREAERYQFQQYRLVMEALEGERGRIAKDLHDGLGGMLSGVKFSLGNIKNKIGLSSDQDLQYERSLDQLDGSIKELRRVAHDMMPDILVLQGLPTALADYCTTLNSMGVVAISFQSIGEQKRTESYREIIIYRVVQELITNVIRHAGATQLIVQLVYNENQVAITVEDNGCGFETGKIGSQGIGLTNIRSRVDFLHGKWNIISSAGAGTSMYIEIPLAEI